MTFEDLSASAVVVQRLNASCEDYPHHPCAHGSGAAVGVCGDGILGGAEDCDSERGCTALCRCDQTRGFVYAPVGDYNCACKTNWLLSEAADRCLGYKLHSIRCALESSCVAAIRRPCACI